MPPIGQPPDKSKAEAKAEAEAKDQDETQNGDVEGAREVNREPPNVAPIPSVPPAASEATGGKEQPAVADSRPVEDKKAHEKSPGTGRP